MNCFLSSLRAPRFRLSFGCITVAGGLFVSLAVPALGAELPTAPPNPALPIPAQPAPPLPAPVKPAPPQPQNPPGPQPPPPGPAATSPENPASQGPVPPESSAAAAIPGHELPAVRKQLANANSQTAQTLQQLTALDLRIFEVGRSIEDMERQVAGLQSRIHKGQQKVARLERRFYDIKKSSNERARRIYKESPGAFLAPLLTVQTMADLERFRTFWISLARDDGRVILDSARFKEKLTVEKTALETASQALAAKAEELKRVRERLDQARQERTASLGRLRQSMGEAMVAEQAILAVQKIPTRAPHLCSVGMPARDERLAALLDWYAPAMGAEPFTPPKLNPTGIVLAGEASWYGPGFEGCRSASGATYRSNQMTAASLSLPFGTLLKASSQGRSVVVVITDRGPYVRGRVLDLSQAAAQAIGITGLGQVTMEVLIPAQPAPAFP